MKAKEYLTSMLSEPDGKSVSFARNICLLLVLYFLLTDAWFYHRTGHLVDHKSLLLQLGWCSTYYATNKIKLLFTPDSKPDDKKEEKK